MGGWQGIETATFHILTPYPGTALYERIAAQNRIISSNWDLYDTRHAVFTPARMSGETLEAGYWQAYRDFYKWSSIFRSAWVQEGWAERLRHVAYVSGWKKFEPVWDWVIRDKQVKNFLPLLEAVLSGFGRHEPQSQGTSTLAPPAGKGPMTASSFREDQPHVNSGSHDWKK